jgi:hypothetical protein
MIRPAATELFICGARGQVPGQTVHSGQRPAFDSPPGAEVTSLVPGGMRPARADPGHRASGLPRNHLLAPPTGVGSCRPPTTRQNANSCEDGVGRVGNFLRGNVSQLGILCPRGRTRRDWIPTRRRLTRTDTGLGIRGGIRSQTMSGRPAGGPNIWQRPGPAFARPSASSTSPQYSAWRPGEGPR